MKRVLKVQNENNEGKNYFIIDGKLLLDSDDNHKYIRFISETENYKIIYKDDIVLIRQKGNLILLTSYYNNEDNIGRKMSYVYIVDYPVTINNILDYLKKDSKLINKDFDQENIELIISKINKNKNLKKIISLILIAISILGVIIYIKK
jgi:guanylate kinase